MSTRQLIFSLEAVPGESPRALEQPNGDLLVPAALRLELSAALSVVELAMDPRALRGAQAFTRVRALLAVDAADDGWQASEAAANLLKAFPLK